MDIQNLEKKGKKELIIIIKMLQELINARTEQDKNSMDFHIKKMREAGEDAERAYREVIRGFRG